VVGFRVAYDRSAIGTVDETRQATLRELTDKLKELLVLRRGVCSVVIGCGEVGAEALQLDLTAGRHILKKAKRLFRRKTEAPHPGIYLDMDADATLVPSRRLRQSMP